MGFLLGSNDGPQAKLAAQLLLVLIVVVQSAVAAFYITARNYIGTIYSDDKEVIDKVATIAHIAAVFQVCDGMSAYIGGVLKGMGHQLIAAGLNLVGFWVIGTMLGGVFAFALSWGVSGIWWGLCAGLFFTSTMGMFILSRIDFNCEAARAQLHVVAVAAQDIVDPTEYQAEIDDDIELMKDIVRSSSASDLPRGDIKRLEYCCD